MKRYRNDSVKPGVGIDKDLGSDYTKQHRGNPWDANPRGNYKSPRGAGAYQQGDADFLNNKLPSDQSGGVGTRNILDDVERNSGTGKPGPIKYGVD